MLAQGLEGLGHAVGVCFGLVPGGDAAAEEDVGDLADTDGGDSWHTLTNGNAGAGNEFLRGAYKITTSATTLTYNPTLGTSRAWLLQIGSLKATATFSLPVPPAHLRLAQRVR